MRREIQRIDADLERRAHPRPLFHQRAALLGHAWRSMPDFYASPDIERLISLANRVLQRPRTVTIARVVNG